MCITAYCLRETSIEWIHFNGVNLSTYNSSVVYYCMLVALPNDDDNVNIRIYLIAYVLC
jgi:hypothetical protein